MKKLIIIFFLVNSINPLFSQDYTFKRVYSETMLKLSGEISVRDSLIILKIDNEVSEIKVKKISDDHRGSKSFKVVVQENSDIEMRISLVQIALSKKETASLLWETKDNFTGTITTYQYYLIPKKE